MCRHKLTLLYRSVSLQCQVYCYSNVSLTPSQPDLPDQTGMAIYYRSVIATEYKTTMIFMQSMYTDAPIFLVQKINQNSNYADTMPPQYIFFLTNVIDF